MQLTTYIIYGIALATFLFLGGFAVLHAFKHAYISPRVRGFAVIFAAVSVVLILISAYFLLTLQF